MQDQVHPAWRGRLDVAVDHVHERMIQVRRRLHAHPELSGQETETTKFVAQELSARNIRVQIGPEGRGLIADLGKPGKRVALRADLDALPITDSKDVEYRSQVPGVMHACGHDAHTAMVLGACLALADLQDQNELPVELSLRAVFQPAEEICEGAQEMMAAGALEQVQALFAAHVDPTRPVGEIATRVGALTAACDEIRLQVRGRGAHAARPHLAIDPVAAAAQLITNVYQILPRTLDALETVVITFTEIHGGDAANAITDLVRVRGTMRTLSRRSRQQAWETLRRLIGAVEAATGAEIELSHGACSPGVENHPEVTETLLHAATHAVGAECVKNLPLPSMGSEDFAYYLEEVPGTMFRLGCVPDSRRAPGLHTAGFDVDDRALAIGAKTLAHAAVLWRLRSDWDQHEPLVD